LADDPTSDQAQMLHDLRKVFPSKKLNIANALRQIRGNGGRYWMDSIDGSYMENWAGSISRQTTGDALMATIQLAREALYKGKFIMFSAGPWGCASSPCSSQEDNAAAVAVPLAVFLMFVEDRAFF
jgi:hypothetical protein